MGENTLRNPEGRREMASRKILHWAAIMILGSNLSLEFSTRIRRRHYARPEGWRELASPRNLDKTGENEIKI